MLPHFYCDICTFPLQGGNIECCFNLELCEKRYKRREEDQKQLDDKEDDAEERRKIRDDKRVHNERLIADAKKLRDGREAAAAKIRDDKKAAQKKKKIADDERRAEKKKRKLELLDDKKVEEKKIRDRTETKAFQNWLKQRKKTWRSRYKVYKYGPTKMIQDLDDNKRKSSSAAKKIRDNKIAEEDNKTAKMIRDLDERIAVASVAKKIQDDKRSEKKRKRTVSRSPLARLDGNQQQPQQHDHDILSSSITSLTPATGSTDADATMVTMMTTTKKKATTTTTTASSTTAAKEALEKKRKNRESQQKCRLKKKGQALNTAIKAIERLSRDNNDNDNSDKEDDLYEALELSLSTIYYKLKKTRSKVTRGPNKKKTKRMALQEKKKVALAKKTLEIKHQKQMKMVRALARKALQEKKKVALAKKTLEIKHQKLMKMVRALAKKILQEQKKQEAVDWRELDNLTKLNKDGITLSTGNHLWLDSINNFRNKVKDFVEKSAGKPEGLSIAFAIDGTDMSKSGLFKFKIPNGEATANSILHQCESIENCVYRNPKAATSSLQVVDEFPSKLPQPFLANRVVVAKTGTLFGETISKTDNLKVQKYKGPGGEHCDDKFKHIIRKPLLGITKKSFLLSRVLEKPGGGILQFFREPDKKKFSIRIEKGELLIMMAHAGLCNHNCEEGLFTIVTDFVLPYDAHREMKITGGLKGKFEKFISDYATSISHL